MPYILHTSCQLNQHLQDSLCQQLLQLDEVSILSPPASTGEGEEDGDGDMEQQVAYTIRVRVYKFFCFKYPVCLDQTSFATNSF